MKKVKKTWAAVLLFLLALGAVACGNGSNDVAPGGGKAGDTIVIGSKNFTENILLAQIMAELIEAKTDLKVERKVNLGGSNIAWNALKQNEIQLYPDYTGTIVVNYYQQGSGTAEETLDKAKKLVQGDGLKALEPFGLNNTYTLAVTKETQQKYNLKTFSDLAKVAGQLTIGVEHEFTDRPDGLSGLEKTYNMKFKKVSRMDHGLKYRAISEGKVDVIDAYATDGQLVVFDLVVLEDDKGFFPPYHALPLIRQDTLEKYPELEEVLGELAGKIDDQTMQKLNAAVDSEGLKAEEVARQFLRDAGLVRE